MLVIIEKDYNALSKRAAHIVSTVIRKTPRIVLGLATGNTPLGLYRELVRFHQQERLDFSQVVTFNLDEYLGLPPDHPASFHRYVQVHLASQINLMPQNIHIPDGMIRDHYEDYCRSYEASIREAGGIDLQVLGIGKTGHIGFNEPTSSLASRTRVKTLAAPTIQDNQKNFGPGECVPPCAITMGIGTILEARRILLLASGAEKSAAIARAIEGPITSTVTASALQLHPEVTVVLDESAATQLKFREYYSLVLENTLQLTPEKIE
jgi:glucosamine-6-phosphate deaminase